MKTVYICSDTVTGIFSGIYDAWKAGKSKEECGISLRGRIDLQLFCEYVETKESGQKAAAVEQLIKKHLGLQAYYDIYHAVLSEDAGKGDAILGTMLEAKRIPDSTRIMEHLGNPNVEKVFELSRRVSGEAHALKGFLRFRELENGVLYAEITPKAQVLTCLAPHFADRLPAENFMICDQTHHMYVVHEAFHKWVLVWDDLSGVKGTDRVSDKEREYAQMWKSFCRVISIESRENKRGQRQHLPLRFRPNMLEFEKAECYNGR